MNRPLPVLYIVDASVAVTGAFIAARNTARALKNHAQIVLVLPQGHTIPAEMLGDFSRVECIPIVNLSKNFSAMIRYLPALVLGVWRLHRWMKGDGAACLQLNDFYLMHGLLLWLLGYRGKIISFVRCDPARLAGFLARPMLMLVSRSSDRLIAVSSFVHHLLPRTEKAEIIYDFYQGPIRASKCWQPHEEKTFVFIGNYIRGKGQDMALQAFALAAQQDDTITLHFYGGDMGLEKNRAYRRELEYSANQLKLASRIQFHDVIAHGYPVLEQAYAALNFSDSESFSMTVLEASGAGVAVIATASGGPQEIIQPDVTGILVPVGNAALAAEAMLKLAKTPALAQTMGQAAAQHVAMNFAFETFRKELIRILDF